MFRHNFVANRDGDRDRDCGVAWCFNRELRHNVAVKIRGRFRVRVMEVAVSEFALLAFEGIALALLLLRLAMAVARCYREPDDHPTTNHSLR
jgi:hypothetical protein